MRECVRACVSASVRASARSCLCLYVQSVCVGEIFSRDLGVLAYSPPSLLAPHHQVVFVDVCMDVLCNDLECIVVCFS